MASPHAYHQVRGDGGGGAGGGDDGAERETAPLAPAAASSSGGSGPTAAAAHGGKFGFMTGAAFTVNYIMGCGFLGIPDGFVQAGLVLGPVVVLLFCIIMNSTKDFLCDVIGRAEALAKVEDIARAALAGVQEAEDAAAEADAALAPSPIVEGRRSGGGGSSSGGGVPVDAVVASGGSGSGMKARARSMDAGLLANEGPGGGGGGGRLPDNPNLAGGIIHPTADEYLVRPERKYEVTDLFAMMVGPRARTMYVVLLSLYMYGALVAYTSVFGSSFAANVPSLHGATCNVESDSDCMDTYRLWVGVFAVICIPLACLELSEQLLVQLVMFGARILVVLLMTGTVFGALSCDGVAFTEMPPHECTLCATLTTHRCCRTPVALPTLDPTHTCAGGGAPLFRVPGLAALMPISVYAFIFHHSVPILAQPLKNPRTIRSVFAAAFVITGVAYLSIGFVVALFFGPDIDSQCNLNWQNYVGCMAAPTSWVGTRADGSWSGLTTVAARVQARLLGGGGGESMWAAGAPLTAAACTNGTTWQQDCVDASNRPAYAHVIAFIILIFPALDVLSAFPLNAMTLGNNLMSACLGEKALQPPAAVASPAADEAAPLAQHAAINGDGHSHGHGHHHHTASHHAPAPRREELPWYHRSPRAHRLLVVIFRLIAACPPIFVAFFTSNLGAILQFAGTIGVAIGFIIPATLYLFSRAKERAVFKYVSDRLLHGGPRPSFGGAPAPDDIELPSVTAGHAATHTDAPLAPELAELTAADRRIAAVSRAALRLHISWREALRVTPLDALFRTPYDTWATRYRIPEAILVVSLGILLFVFVQVSIDVAAKGNSA